MRIFTAVLALAFVPTLCAVNPYDPGPCTKKKRGKFVVVRDRNDDDKVVVCIRQHGKCQWNMMNGHSYGNYFDPAKDCSSIVDIVPKARSGIYWFRTEKGPFRAWCDVDTDNGGFILIGVKDTPETWAIPSNFTPVHPEGPARWSSAFGDMNVLDFRVQISTSKDFDDTRAHWYYRFRSSRILSQLLMSNAGGCSHLFPGIGNIAYVKDLVTKSIATRNFNCSRFSTSGLGWDKMNKCFQEACPVGFAYLYDIQVDTSGSYSYSVNSARSGIQDDQTAFIGCDHGECCACFGPDSKQNYCAPKCQPINGGTVLKAEDNITVWFWVRSSLPKRVWKQCMEFEEKNDAGKMETWRVEGGVKRKGPCSAPEDVTMNDGVVVVSNNQSMRKLPKIDGLLSYLLDERKLYIKEKSRWEALATQAEVKHVIGDFQRFKQDVDKKFKKVTTYDTASCKQILMRNGNAGSGVYQIRVGNSEVINAYCQMSSISGCSGSGWTLVMKIDGASSTFRYHSSYWTNRNTYNDNSNGRNGGLDNRQFKGSTYWKTSFSEICVGMKYGGRLTAFAFPYPASSLYSLIADGRYRATHLGRSKWKSLIYGSSLQPNCNREGFNLYRSRSYIAIRLGFIGNEQNDCHSPDSFIGLGGHDTQCSYSHPPNAAGNLGQCAADKGNKNARAMAYILVR